MPEPRAVAELAVVDGVPDVAEHVLRVERRFPDGAVTRLDDPDGPDV